MPGPQFRITRPSSPMHPIALGQGDLCTRYNICRPASRVAEGSEHNKKAVLAIRLLWASQAQQSLLAELGDNLRVTKSNGQLPPLAIPDLSPYNVHETPPHTWPKVSLRADGARLRDPVQSRVVHRCVTAACVICFENASSSCGWLTSIHRS
eukprot:968951-Prorocentrum_minimum.AAC.4